MPEPIRAQLGVKKHTDPPNIGTKLTPVPAILSPLLSIPLVPVQEKLETWLNSCDAEQTSNFTPALSQLNSIEWVRLSEGRVSYYFHSQKCALQENPAQ